MIKSDSGWWSLPSHATDQGLATVVTRGSASLRSGAEPVAKRIFGPYPGPANRSSPSGIDVA